jgi:hypothetical protein
VWLAVHAEQNIVQLVLVYWGEALEEAMKGLTLVVAAAAFVAVVAQANAASFPVSGRDPALTGNDAVKRVAVRVYVHHGHRYCFYFSGWHGPGWYRCGFAWRRGLGWGGAYGWNAWTYGPYEHRHHPHSGSRTHIGVQRQGQATTTEHTRGGMTKSGTHSSGETTGAASHNNHSSTKRGARISGGDEHNKK